MEEQKEVIKKGIKGTTIWIPINTRNKLIKHSIGYREPHYRVIDRLVKEKEIQDKNGRTI